MRIVFPVFGEVAAAFAPAIASKGATAAAHHILIDKPGGVEKLRARAGASSAHARRGDEPRLPAASAKACLANARRS
jgi:hypothetical protein